MTASAPAAAATARPRRAPPQGHFNEFNFALEVLEYEREGIQWSFDDFRFQTNTRCIELIEDRRRGILALLDEQAPPPPPPPPPSLPGAGCMAAIGTSLGLWGRVLARGGRPHSGSRRLEADCTVYRPAGRGRSGPRA